MNKLFLYNRPQLELIWIGVGDKRSKRKVQLTNDEALKLAYKLMSLAGGGETFGMEEFKS